MIATIEELQTFFQERRQLGIKPGLQRMERMTQALDYPNQTMKAIHIAGTNGKGSTASFLKSILKEAGYTVGTFMSPPKVIMQDMIEVNDQPIAAADFVAHFNRLLPVIQQLDQQGDPPSEFEIQTMIAFIYLHTQADVSIIETGMGGSEDSTNIVSPLVSMVTTIGLDHQKFLGDSYEDIAFHKAGVTKPYTPVIIGRVLESTKPVFKKKAERQSAPLIWLEEQLAIQQYIAGDSQDQMQLTVDGQPFIFTKQLLGKHQVDNAALAILACQLLNEAGFRITRPIIEKGLASAFLPGRFEKISQHPTVFLDSAHNQEGIEVFCQAVAQINKAASKTVLFAAFCDKPIQAMLTTLAQHFDNILCTSFDHPRSAGAEELISLAGQAKQVEWQELLQGLDESDTLYITGSVEFISQVRQYMLARF
ncbi:bifunctional folylpolyglutamate synthase/dihydrofolate synthase [Gracilibacillus alcaliphilus]|uniref:bifunctional folylpolyglutamate synthase/dihydrofolate synthase n=1 Tax=Gracilibacillus alcaliphilus TaxID=1401441 RepID=UPI001959C4EF|nr:folylpolyglutamate synthase/dihydrofolate synthase family protein [Gracilibacillus alcaliphilus]MBM7678552.1 dihydrofolate synthase/folylpolyglutamate synthase [Gracilibacillus alcaliphilus]